MSARHASAVLSVVGLLATGCARPPAPPRSAPAVEPVPARKAPEAGARAPRLAAPADERLPVPESVAELHKTVFETTSAQAKVEHAICLVTLHDAALEQGHFYPLVLFADGSVATWRQTPTASEEPFLAKLGADEQRRASELVKAIAEERAMAQDTFHASATVMGVSTRVGARVETLYFDNDRIPSALSQLVGLLKHRLEETNRAP